MKYIIEADFGYIKCIRILTRNILSSHFCVNINEPNTIISLFRVNNEENLVRSFGNGECGAVDVL